MRTKEMAPLLLLMLQLNFLTIGTAFGFTVLPTARRLRVLEAEAASKPFDEGEFEADRLKKDAEAMGAMKIEADKQFAKLRTPWKWR